MTTASAPVVVGIDLGTSSMKAVALDRTGRVLASARAAYATHRPEPGAAEQTPADWVRAMERVCAALDGAVPSSRWAALGLSGMIPSLVLLDRGGHAIGRALTWEDARGERDAGALRRRVGARALYETTGQWVDGRYLLPMWRWTVAHRPALAAGTAYVAGAKDYLVRFLTGELATDPSTAAGFGCFDLRTGSWDRGIASAAGLGGGPALPNVVPSETSLALARRAARMLGLRASTRVVVGAADSVLSADALGVVRSGEIAYVAGTSTVIASFVERYRPDPRHRYLVTPASRPGRWGLEMDLLSTGSAVRWCASLLGLGRAGESRLLALAERARGDAQLVFLPYLAPGEQGALWDPDLRGAIAGLTTRHGAADVARALVDGIVLESRRCVDVLRARGAPPRIRATGSLARSVWFRRLLAGATGCEVVPASASTAASAAAIGAAALCDPAVADAVHANASASRGAVPPDGAAAAGWDERWRRHEETRRGLRPIG
jgi:xylulokinase